MAGGIERVRLDDGTVVWARISAADQEELDEGGYWDTGLGDRVIDMAGGLAGTVGGVVRSLRAGLDTPAPVEVSVSFGIELTAQSGKIVSAIAEGGGTSSLTVSLTWTEPAAAAGRTDPATAGGAVVPSQSPAPGAA
ncbi:MULTISPECIES: CU044_2847 family protein [unclassified Streptomyces]|uniref:CU044_2847 family protein n=1 Tax=unclassified Streptomyces TaxID=2593676 RepID=UPI001E3926E9|nr:MULTISPECIES: CU044_2847 family protein [unclassified Streptomyces]